MSRYRPIAVALSVCTAVIAGCAPSAPPLRSAGSPQPRLSVVASTDVYGDIARPGRRRRRRRDLDHHRPVGQDPHTYQATARTSWRSSKADADHRERRRLRRLHVQMLAPAHASAPVINVVDLSGQHAAAGGELNEHVWYDLPTVAALAGALADRLSAARSAGRQRVPAGERRRSFEPQLDAAARPRGRHRPQRDRRRGSRSPNRSRCTCCRRAGWSNRTPATFSAAVEEEHRRPARACWPDTSRCSPATRCSCWSTTSRLGPADRAGHRGGRTAGVPVVPVTETLPAGQDYLPWMQANLSAVQIRARPAVRRDG